MRLIHCNSSGQVREETFKGRAFLVAPVSMLVPGVLPGSQGALMYPKEEVIRNAVAWNGMPLTLGHPSKDGSPVSARSPSIIEEFGLGQVFNVDVSKGKLDGEAWFDKERVQKLAPDLLNRLQGNQQVELSTGLFLDTMHRNGEFSGKPYSGIARNLKPDHLAILLDQRGACSIADGCGVLMNEDGVHIDNESTMPKSAATTPEKKCKCGDPNDCQCGKEVTVDNACPHRAVTCNHGSKGNPGYSKLHPDSGGSGGSSKGKSGGWVDDDGKSTEFTKNSQWATRDFKVDNHTFTSSVSNDDRAFDALVGGKFDPGEFDRLIEYGFTDSKERETKTGVFKDSPGKARAVFREVLNDVDTIMKTKPNALAFSATGDSRNSLYSSLTRKGVKKYPGYRGVEILNNAGTNGYYALVKQSVHDEVMARGGYDGPLDDKFNKAVINSNNQYDWLAKYSTNKFFDELSCNHGTKSNPGYSKLHPDTGGGSGGGGGKKSSRMKTVLKDEIRDTKDNLTRKNIHPEQKAEWEADLKDMQGRLSELEGVSGKDMVKAHDQVTGKAKGKSKLSSRIQKEAKLNMEFLAEDIPKDKDVSMTKATEIIFGTSGRGSSVAKGKLRAMANLGYLTVTRKGRRERVSVTDKGRALLATNEGVWRTVSGARVFIEDGKITKGPKGVIGKSATGAGKGGSGHAKSTGKQLKSDIDKFSKAKGQKKKGVKADPSKTDAVRDTESRLDKDTGHAKSTGEDIKEGVSKFESAKKSKSAALKAKINEIKKRPRSKNNDAVLKKLRARMETEQQGEQSKAKAGRIASQRASSRAKASRDKGAQDKQTKSRRDSAARKISAAKASADKSSKAGQRKQKERLSDRRASDDESANKQKTQPARKQASTGRSAARGGGIGAAAKKLLGGTSQRGQSVPQGRRRAKGDEEGKSIKDPAAGHAKSVGDQLDEDIDIFEKAKRKKVNNSLPPCVSVCNHGTKSNPGYSKLHPDTGGGGGGGRKKSKSNKFEGTGHAKSVGDQIKSDVSKFESSKKGPKNVGEANALMEALTEMRSDNGMPALQTGLKDKRIAQVEKIASQLTSDERLTMAAGGHDEMQSIRKKYKKKGVDLKPFDDFMEDAFQGELSKNLFP